MIKFHISITLNINNINYKAIIDSQVYIHYPSRNIPKCRTGKVMHYNNMYSKCVYHWIMRGRSQKSKSLFLNWFILVLGGLIQDC